MAEIIYKKVSELDGATVPLAGTEVIMAIQGGASKKATWQGIFGSGWWAKLAAAFTAFKAPDADHADDADTLVSETPSDFHDAAQLTGAINLDRIPATLTGKTASACSGNAATATTAAECSGNAATATLAANSTLAAGVDLVNGAAGTSGEWEIVPSATYVIPKGLYMVTVYLYNNQASLEINNGSSWIGSSFICGILLVDGTNYRIKNNNGTYPAIVVYRKLA